MRSHAVVLTYPGHFLQTQLTLRSLRLYLPSIKNITVLVDDISPWAWPNYVDHCRLAYNQTDVQPLSQHKFLHNIQPGWLRQQMVKMHLDLIINHNEVFVTDGDVVFRTQVPYQTTPVNLVDADQSDKTADLQRTYVTKALGQHIPFSLYLGRRPDFSAAGFRDLDLQMLMDIRNLVQHNTGQIFLNYHMNLKSIFGISEWELIENYRLSVLYQLPNFTLFSCHNLNTDLVALQPHWFSTSWATDTEFGLSWWQEQGVDYINSVWDLLPQGPLPIGK